MNRYKAFSFILIVSPLLLANIDVEAQCSMCKAVLESNMQNGESSVGRGINDGIVYIMFVPYMLLAVVGYFMYKHYKKEVAKS